MNSLFAECWRRRGVRGFFAALVVLFALSSLVLAQTETGTITGTVTDPSGAVVPKAKVTVANMATGTKRETVTDDRGTYLVSNLLPAVYSVSASATGFAKLEQRIEVTVGTKVALNFQLTLGAATTTVEVQAVGGVQVNIVNQTLGAVISSKEISEGPTLNADPYTLVATVGNIADTDASPSGVIGVNTGAGAGVIINGLRAASTNILLDGAANNDEFVGTRGQQIPLESVEEFSVLTNNFTAEYGRASGGIVNLATKSGTNAFHGSVYEINRNSFYSANDFFNNASGITRPHYNRNQFGYAFGGPVKKNKLFFFSNTEWTRLRSAATVQAIIPDAQLIAASSAQTKAFFSAFGQLRSNLQTLQRFSRADLTGLGSDPCPKSPPPPPAPPDACANYGSIAPMFDKVGYGVPADSGAGNPQNTYDTVNRVDWNLSDRTQMYFRYARYHELNPAGVVDNSPYAGPTANGFDSGQSIIGDNALISLTKVVGSHMTSQTKFVYNRLSLNQPLGTNPVGPTLYFNKNFATPLNGLIVNFPGYSPSTPGNSIPFGGPQNFYQSYEDVSYVHGSHDLRFGGSWVFFQDNRTFGAYEEAVESLGSAANSASMDRLLTGKLSTFTVAIDPQGKLPCGSPGLGGNVPAVVTPNCTITLPTGQPSFSRSNRYNEFAFYGEDSWKARPRLTINLGLRWEYYGVQHNKNPLLDSNFYLGSGGSIQEQIRNGDVSVAPLSAVHGLWAKDYKDFGPRLGFAWDIFGNGKTSLRGGWGIAYERNFGNVTFNIIQNVPAYETVDLNGVGAAADPGCCTITTSNLGGFAGTGTKALPRASLRNVDQNIKTAYAQLYDASLEREVVHNILVAVQYSGSKGARLYTLDPVNRSGTGNFYLGDPCNGSTDPNLNDCSSRLRGQQYGTINRREGLGFSSYNALNIEVRINNWANSGLTLVSNYTYSHAFDNLSSTFSTSSGSSQDLGLLDPYNPHLDRGPADFDIRHRIAVSGTWEVPFAKNTHNVLKQVLDGWIIAPVVVAHTGTPFTYYDSTNTFYQEIPRIILTSNVPRTGSPTPIVGVGDLFTYLTIPGSAVKEFTNPLTGNNEFGPYPKNMTGRNFFRGPGTWAFNVGIHKKFFITERYNLEFKADLFNAFNHANLFFVANSNDFAVTPGGVQACRGGNNNLNCSNSNDQHRNVQLGLKFSF